MFVRFEGSECRANEVCHEDVASCRREPARRSVRSRVAWRRIPRRRERNRPPPPRSVVGVEERDWDGAGLERTSVPVVPRLKYLAANERAFPQSFTSRATGRIVEQTHIRTPFSATDVSLARASSNTYRACSMYASESATRHQ